MDLVRAKGYYNDFHVEELYRQLPDFEQLLDQGCPVSEILGTEQFTSAMFYLELPLMSKENSFSRSDRI